MKTAAAATTTDRAATCRATPLVRRIASILQHEKMAGKMLSSSSVDDFRGQDNLGPKIPPPAVESLLFLCKAW